MLTDVEAWKAKDIIRYYNDWYDWAWAQGDITGNVVERYKSEFYTPVDYQKPTYEPKYFGIAQRLLKKYGPGRTAKMVAVSFLLDDPPHDFGIFGSVKFTSMLDNIVDREFVSCLIINPTLSEVICQ